MMIPRLTSNINTVKVAPQALNQKTSLKAPHTTVMTFNGIFQKQKELTASEVDSVVGAVTKLDMLSSSFKAGFEQLNTRLKTEMSDQKRLWREFSTAYNGGSTISRQIDGNEKRIKSTQKEIEQLKKQEAERALQALPEELYQGKALLCGTDKKFINVLIKKSAYQSEQLRQGLTFQDKIDLVQGMDQFFSFPSAVSDHVEAQADKIFTRENFESVSAMAKEYLKKSKKNTSFTPDPLKEKEIHKMKTVEGHLQKLLQQPETKADYMDYALEACDYYATLKANADLELTLRIKNGLVVTTPYIETLEESIIQQKQNYELLRDVLTQL